MSFVCSEDVCGLFFPSSSPADEKAAHMRLCVGEWDKAVLLLKPRGAWMRHVTPPRHGGYNHQPLLTKWPVCGATTERHLQSKLWWLEGGWWQWRWWAGERVYAGYSPDPDVYPEVMHRQVVATETADGHKCCAPAPETRTDFKIGFPPPKERNRAGVHLCRDPKQKSAPTRTKAD